MVSTGVLVLLVTMLGARSRDISLNGSTVVDTLLWGERAGEGRRRKRERKRREGGNEGEGAKWRREGGREGRNEGGGEVGKGGRG